MKDATRLDIYFKDDKALLLIPLYQRKYSWKKKHCQRLYADLEKIHTQNIPSHFFGSIVYMKASETENDLLIIDGQQRITTISLLILAAINAVHNGEMKCDNEKYVEDTRDKFLMSQYRKHVERKIKLKPIDDDRVAYDALFTNDEEQFVPADQSGVTSNYLFFYNIITSSGNKLSFEDLIEAIERLIIIDICLDSRDNPQLIFESLNSCGKDLEEADKVRNYLLMSESKEKQEDYYYKYWSKIEKNTDNEPTMFIRDYLTIKNNVISSQEELYFDFKRFDEDEMMPREELLEDMLKYSRYYRQAGKGETGKARIDGKLRQVASIGSNVCRPFYMQLLDYANENALSEDVLYDVFDVVENYWARRIICGWPANVMQKTFALLHSDIMRIYRNHQKRNMEVPVSYVEVMKYILLKKQGTGEFPSDVYVDESFPQRQVYKMPPSYRAFLLERMENQNSKERDDQIIQKMEDGRISIEHVMPQNLNAQWKKDLGPQAEEIKERYLHTFANLTLTGYNSEYSNRPYIEKWNGYTFKKKVKGSKEEKEVVVTGYKDSAFRLSNYMKTHKQWTEIELQERGQLLLKSFKQLWPMITTDYKPLEKEVDVVSLDDDDVEFTGRMISAYIYKGERHQVTTWKDMLVEVCKTLYGEKPTEMLYLATKNSYLYSKEESFTSAIAENCHVWSSSNTKSKRSTLLYIFKELNISPSFLEIELVPQGVNGDADEDE